MRVIALGIMATAIICFMGAFGGAHLNPAVTLALAPRRPARGGVSDFRALIMEILLTSGPVSTILGTG